MHCDVLAQVFIFIFNIYSALRMSVAGWKAAKMSRATVYLVEFYVSLTSVNVCLETLTISSNKDVDWSFCGVMAIIFQM